MGKGNRNRNDRYESVYDMSNGGAAVKTAKTAGKKDNTAALLISVIAVLVLVALAIFLFTSSGIVERGTVYVSSDSFEVTGTMLPYYQNLAYSDAFQRYYVLYYYYYGADDQTAYNYAAQAMSGQTLDTYFDSAIASAKEIVALCQEATAAGVVLTDEDQKTVKDTLTEFGSLSVLGSGVKKSDVKKAIELQVLASKYVETVEEGIKADLDDEALKTFIDENKTDYYTADFLKYELVLKAEDYEDDALTYAELEKVADKYVADLKGAESEDAFKKLVIAFDIEKSFNATMKNNLGELTAPDAALIASAKAAIVENTFNVLVKGEPKTQNFTDNETYKDLFITLSEGYISTCEDTLNALTGSEAYNPDSEDEVIKWLSSDDLKVGATMSTDDSTEEEYAYSIYYVTREMHIDDAQTKSFAHMLIAVERSEETKAEEYAAAKEKAEKAYAEYKAGEQTLEAFKKLAETYNEDSNSVYEDTKAEQMVSEIDSWIFDEARKTGDVEIIQTDYGYHVTYFIGDGNLAYYTGAVNDYTDSKYSDILAELEEKYVTVNEKAVLKRGGTIETEAEETSETEAAA